MAVKKASEGTQVITIKPVKVSKANITIVGDTPLLVHAWGEKAKKMMLAAQQKTKKDKKAMDIRDPFMEFCEALYWVTPKPAELMDTSIRDTERMKIFEEAVANGAKFGFPVTSIKQAALAACYRAGIIPNQVGMKCAFYLNAVEGFDAGTGSELAVIDTDEPPQFREDMVKIGGVSKVADLRYRPMFTNWKIRLVISLIEVGTFTMESIINAINLGGFMNGIGEWRMERDGDFGRFHVQLEDE